jgi:hypothetical protein
MLDVYVILTNNPNSDTKKLKDSFSLDNVDFHLVDKIDQINDSGKSFDWYFVIYDDEHLSEDLQDALPSYLENGTESFYTMYRIAWVDNDITKSKISDAPRLFKKEIKLLNNTLCPDCGFPVGKSNHVLDGFIKGNE